MIPMPHKITPHNKSSLTIDMLGIRKGNIQTHGAGSAWHGVPMASKVVALDSVCLVLGSLAAVHLLALLLGAVCVVRQTCGENCRVE